MPGINDAGFKKMWHGLKKDAGISSSPWYKKADAAVSKFVESYQKARKKAGEPDDALSEDILKVINSLKQLDESLDKFMDKKGLNDIKDVQPKQKETILKAISSFKKEVENEKDFYNQELQERLREAGDVKKLLAQDALRKLGTWKKQGSVDLVKKKNEKEEEKETKEIPERIKKGEKPTTFNHGWWRARKPKDLKEDPKMKVTMDFFWDHYQMYKEANQGSTDNDQIRSRINCLRQMTPGLTQSEKAIQNTIANCDDDKHANSKAALQHYLTMIKAYKLQRKQFIAQEKNLAKTNQAITAVMDEILKGDPDY